MGTLSSTMYPAEYTIKESQRAKHVRLKISLYDGSLTVVVPRGFDHRQIPQIVHEKQGWIERARQRVACQREQVGCEPSGGLPDQVRLRAIGEDWRLDYMPGAEGSVRAAEGAEGVLVLGGEVEWVDGCHAVLRSWVRNKARAHLVPWVQALSAEHDLPIARTIVRGQRTRWASFSHKGTVSLNRKLLFIPAPLVEYVLIHELCHTVHFNHSPRFWEMVGERVPEYESLDAELRDAWRYVPTWMNGHSRPQGV
jgi:predicted metal-dependent hydrolase